MSKLTFIPMPASFYPIVAAALKADGYTKMKAGASKYIPKFASALPEAKDLLDAGETFKYFKYREEYLPFKMVFISGKAPAARRSTAKASGKATASGAPVKPADWNDIAARTEYLRACKAFKSGKAAPQATKAPQASGKLTDAEKLAAIGAALANLDASIAALLAS